MLRLLPAKWFLVLSFTVFCSCFSLGSNAQCKLILQLTVDQLRGDSLMKLEDRFTGGFQYLIDNGAWYTNANYQHSTTFTAVGHAVIATGGYPSQHGIIGNDWVDRNTHEHMYCYFDPDHHVLGQQPSDESATSPRNLISSTIADEIYLAGSGKAKVFSVSIKDRAAIPCGGSYGKAFWYDKQTGGFTTSTYYYQDYPDWVQVWNKSRPADEYLSKQWTLLRPQETYIAGDNDDRPCEHPYKQMGRTFPHPIGSKDDLKSFYSTLRFTPMGDALTLAFAKQLIDHEKIGQSDTTDYFSLSLSATDYIGHCFGPFSLEYEDNLLQLDKNLAGFFAYLDGKIGLEHILIAFTSDHGTDGIPEYRRSLAPTAAQKSQTDLYNGCQPDGLGGRHYPDKFVAKLNGMLKKQFSTDRDLIAAFWNPNLYLDPAAIHAAGLDKKTVSRVLAEAVMTLDGFALAFSYDDMMCGNLPKNKLADKMSNAFNPLRSGDVMVIQKPFWYLYPEADTYGAMHGSPYTYDTHVPMIFAGADLKRMRISRPVEPADIAATLSEYLGNCFPSGCVGEPLEEVLKQKNNRSKNR